MENNPLNQTNLGQMPPSMQGNNTAEPKKGKALFISLLIVLIAGAIGYWFLKEKPVMMNEDSTQIETSLQSEEDTTADLDMSETELNELYFEGTAQGL